MNVDRINYINIGLMLFSCVLAFFIPFELFLFSYAVLGPLHYLTEISWLHNRNYFAIKGSKDWLILFILGILILFTSYYDNLAVWLAGGAENLSEDHRAWIQWLGRNGTGITFLALGSAVIMAFVKNTAMRIGSYVILGAIGFALSQTGETSRDPIWFYLLFAVFLPTLIHVFVFTGAFILSGALKSKSRSGYVSLLVFIGCAISFIFIQPEFGWYEVGGKTKESYGESFEGLNFEMLRILVPGMVSELTSMEAYKSLIYNEKISVVITRFIAYAYTYHYLNWFSKTKVIRWHEVPRPWLISVFAMWIAAVALYAYDYAIGLGALYFLSFLHVYLEFPLNWISFKNIGSYMFRRGSAAA